MWMASREFAYITITETKPLRSGFARHYDEFGPILKRFGTQLPEQLLGCATHLDPDFDYLTYGDQGQRGKRIATLRAGDFLAFFAALRPMDDASLVYALIGLYMIKEIVPAQEVSPERWMENAHTRRETHAGDVVVRAYPGVSGRLRRCIPIGEYRDRAYRVRHDLLVLWGGLDIKDGFIQRSVRLPAFLDAERFYQWFLSKTPELVAANNPVA